MVETAFTKSRRLHGSPRIHADLRDVGWQVSEKSVAASMARQGVGGAAEATPDRYNKPADKRTVPLPDLLRRDFTVWAPEQEVGRRYLMDCLYPGGVERSH